MKRKDKIKFVLIVLMSFALVSTYSCGSKETEVSRATLDAFRVVLEENEKVVQQLVSDSEKIPETKNLLDAMVSAQGSVVEVGLKRALEEETRILQDAQNLDKEKFYDSFSRFTEHLSVSMKTGGVKFSDYNKFYCPMVKKYWIAKGVEVVNPFAPDMRDCGELSN